MENWQISKIAEFYRDKCVFITGATGFIGKVLIEKLLRSCELDTIYVLVRPKKGLNPDKRIDQVLSSQVFRKVNDEKSTYKDKIKVISGDVSQPNLGVSQDDVNILIENVSVVFHLAATRQSNQNIKTAMEQNVFSVRKLLELCRKLPKLQAIVYTSTAYCNYEESIIEEKIYPAKVTVEFAGSCLDYSDEGKLEYLKNHLMEHPDTYIFSKCIAENLLLQERGNLPLAIMRPSVVISSHQEPFPGWVEKSNLPSALATGLMKGILRTQIAYQEKVIDVIPVDLVVNMTLAVAWYTAMKSHNRLLVYHCTSGSENPITWGKVYSLFQQLVYQYPPENIFRYPSFSLKRNPAVNKIAIYVDHYLPAALADVFNLLTGGKPRMINTCKKLNSLSNFLEYYATKEWKFVSKNKYLLLNEMTELDKKSFNFDIKVVQWKIFLLNYVLGIREYVMKESPSNIKKARNNLRRQLWTNRIINVSFFVGIGYLISTWASTDLLNLTSLQQFVQFIWN